MASPVSGRALLLLQILAVLGAGVAKISDKRLCADSECIVPLSKAKTVLAYTPSEEGILSFRSNVEVLIYSKSAGDNEDLWGVVINGVRGYAPKKFLREYKILGKAEHVVSTERDEEINITSENEPAIDLPENDSTKQESLESSNDKSEKGDIFLTAEDAEYKRIQDSFDSQTLELSKNKVDKIQLEQEQKDQLGDSQVSGKIKDDNIDTITNEEPNIASSEFEYSAEETISNPLPAEGLEIGSVTETPLPLEVDPSPVDYEVIDGTTIYFDDPPAEADPSATTPLPPLEQSYSQEPKHNLPQASFDEHSTTNPLDIKPTYIIENGDPPPTALPDNQQGTAYLKNLDDLKDSSVKYKSADNPDIKILNGDIDPSVVAEVETSWYSSVAASVTNFFLDSEGKGAEEEEKNKSFVDDIGLDIKKEDLPLPIHKDDSEKEDSFGLPKKQSIIKDSFETEDLKENLEIKIKEETIEKKEIIEVNETENEDKPNELKIEEKLDDNENTDTGYFSSWFSSDTTVPQDEVSTQTPDVSDDSQSSFDTKDILVEEKLDDSHFHPRPGLHKGNSQEKNIEASSDSQLSVEPEPSNINADGHVEPVPSESSRISNDNSLPNVAGPSTPPVEGYNSEQPEESKEFRPSQGVEVDTPNREKAFSGSDSVEPLGSTNKQESESNISDENTAQEHLESEGSSTADTMDHANEETLTDQLLKTSHDLLPDGLTLGLEAEIASGTMSSGVFNLLLIIAVTVLAIYVIYLIIQKVSREGPLLEAMNKIEREYRIAQAENGSLHETLNQLQQQLRNSENHEHISGAADATLLNEQLEQIKSEFDAEKSELNARVLQLEQELEESTSNAMEMHKMLSELLVSQKDTSAFQASVDQLQGMLDDQQEKVESLTSDLAIKTRLNEELQNELSAARNRADKQDNQVEQLSETLSDVKSGKAETMRRLEEESVAIQDLQTTNESLLQEKSQYSTQNEEFKKELEDLKNTINQLRDTCELKESELEVSKECLKKLRLASDDKENISESNLSEIFNIITVKGELQRVQKESVKFKEQLSHSEAANKNLTEAMNNITEEVSGLRVQHDAAMTEREEANSKLGVLTQYFQEKEQQLTKELDSQSGLRLDAEGSAESIARRIQSYELELASYKTQMESLKKDMEEQEQSLKASITAAEQKAHENWLLSRSSERKSEDLRHENSQLRNRLTLLQKEQEDINLKIIKPQPKRVTANGSVSSMNDVVDGDHSAHNSHDLDAPPFPHMPPHMMPPPPMMHIPPGMPPLPHSMPGMHGMPPLPPGMPPLPPGGHLPPGMPPLPPGGHLPPGMPPLPPGGHLPPFMRREPPYMKDDPSFIDDHLTMPPHMRDHGDQLPHRVPPAGRMSSPPYRRPSSPDGDYRNDRSYSPDRRNNRSYSPTSEHSHYSGRGHSPPRRSSPPRRQHSPESNHSRNSRSGRNNAFERLSPQLMGRRLSPDRRYTRSPDGYDRDKQPPRQFYEADYLNDSDRLQPPVPGKKTSTPVDRNGR